MSELRSAIDGYRCEPLGSLPDARAEEEFAELWAAREALEAEVLRRLGDLDRRGVYRRDGHLSAASWLVSAFASSWGHARRSVRVATALETMPLVRAAFEAGSVSSAAVEVLTDAHGANPEAFATSEEMLIEAARLHPVEDLQRVCAYWRSACEAERAVVGDEDPSFVRRRLHVSPTVFGMVRIDGDLDAETGETVLTALRSVEDAWARSDAGPLDRSSAQRRADALGEVGRGYLDRADRPVVAGERPHVSVTVGLDALRGGGDAELDHAGPVGAGLARRLACDASVSRVVLGPRSEPLDVGRRTPVVSPAMRRAVVIRDSRCRFPGCDRPHTWCDAHHVTHWADGGATALPNLVLLCRRHHRVVHERFGLEMVEGRPVFRRPDGSVLEDRAPP
jgi:Domain of unknown function (DUF222)/HNH endonuclease